MILASNAHTAGGTPCATGGIVQLGARRTTYSADSPCDQYHAIRQQRGGMTNTGNTHTTGSDPCVGGGIV